MSVYRLDSGELNRLLEALRSAGWDVVGPKARDGTIIFDTVNSAEEFPVGLTDVHSQGAYRLEAHGGPTYFGYNTGPVSLKRFLFPPSSLLFRSRRQHGRFVVEGLPEEPKPVAVVGARACDLAAMAIQDRVFLGDSHRDEAYAKRRDKLFIVAVNCASAGHNCFCTSMETGPEVKEHFDILLTEVAGPDHHYFLMHGAAGRGAALASSLAAPVATDGELAAGRAVVENAKATVTKRMDTRGVKQLLYHCAESAHWDDVAKRCLACTNCTMVCPTCFCSTVVDSTDLAGATAERTRVWDSCFTTEYSSMHGGAVRESTAARYRQWITHKLAGWQDQFGMSGCVGCGRCITWCPVGIDITEEVTGLRVLTETSV